MKKLKVMTVVGTRPEIIRLSRVLDALDASEAIEHIIVHTGQNYDYELNQIFFDDLGLRKPDYFLEAAGKTATETVGNILIKIDPLLDTNISIDIDNNIHYTYTDTFHNIIDLLKTNNGNITIAIENHIFNILISKLTFSKYQIYSIKNQGLAKININNILDNSYKSDIIFHIYLS